MTIYVKLRGKVCRQCQQLWPLEKFTKSKNGKDGRTSWCNYCRAKSNKRWRHDGRLPKPDYLSATECLFDGCSAVPVTRGYCIQHYGRLKKYGDPSFVKEFQPTNAERAVRSPTCAVEGCNRPRQARIWCRMHNSRWVRHGDPLLTTRAPSTPGKTKADRKAYVLAYKDEHGCADCDYSGTPLGLTFDHLPGTIKVRDIKSGGQFGWQALMDEIAKCEVLCFPCHITRTSERRKEVMPVIIVSELEENVR